MEELKLAIKVCNNIELTDLWFDKIFDYKRKENIASERIYYNQSYYERNKEKILAKMKEYRKLKRRVKENELQYRR